MIALKLMFRVVLLGSIKFAFCEKSKANVGITYSAYLRVREAQEGFLKSSEVNLISTRRMPGVA